MLVFEIVLNGILFKKKFISKILYPAQPCPWYISSDYNKTPFISTLRGTRSSYNQVVHIIGVHWFHLLENVYIEPLRGPRRFV